MTPRKAGLTIIALTIGAVAVIIIVGALATAINERAC